MLCVIGGVRTPEDDVSGSHPDSHVAIFMPEGHVPLWREGEEYNTRKGNNSARIAVLTSSLSGSEPPATSGSVRSPAVGLTADVRTSAMGHIAPISISDLNTTINHEPRLLDTRIAERLGYERPADIRDLIERNSEELETYGGIIRAIRKNTGRGRPANEYFLNEAQTLLICMFSKTANAAACRKEVIEVYLAYRRGELSNNAEQLPPTPKPLTLREKRLLVAECRKVMGVKAAQQMWVDLDMPSGQPDQAELALPRRRDGLGMIIIDGNIVTFDTNDHCVTHDDEIVLAVIPERTGTSPRMEIVKVNAYPEHHPYGERTALLPEPSPSCPMAARIVNVLGRVLSVEKMGVSQ